MFSVYKPLTRYSFANIFSQSVNSISFSLMVLFEAPNQISVVSMSLANAISVSYCIILCSFEI